jgi:hypothetical protein
MDIVHVCIQCRQMDYKLCKCLHYGYCNFPSRSVSICLFSPQTDGEHKQIKKHLTCEDVIQWILVWTINFTFMHHSIQDEMSKKIIKKLNLIFINNFQDYYHYFIFDQIIIYKPNNE